MTIIRSPHAYRNGEYMREILENIALILLNEYGIKNNIDISGTHLAKNGRGFMWSLCNNITGKTILTVSFHKSSVPTYSINTI